MTRDIDLLQWRALKRGVAIGALLMATVAAGMFYMADSHAERGKSASDRRADSLAAVIAEREAVIREDSIIKAELTARADSSSALARLALAQPRRTAFVTRTDPSAPAAGDTVTRVTVQRAIDAAPHPVPKFVIDAIAESEAKLAYVMRAWQDSEKARLFADSVYIPDLRRQLDDSGVALRTERQRVAERDRTIESKDRDLRIRKGRERLAWAIGLIAAGVAIVK